MSVPTLPQINIRPKAYVDAVRMSWAAPASDGGSAITGYTITMDGGGTETLSPFVTDYLWEGLTQGDAYTFSITAENGNGSSPAATFRTVSACDRASVVQSITATKSGTTEISLSWTAPEFTNGGPIGWYILKSISNDGSDPVITKTVKEYTTELVVNGLNSNSTYEFTVRAVNDAGYSPDVKSPSVDMNPSEDIGITITNYITGVEIGNMYVTDQTITGMEPGKTYYCKIFISTNNSLLGTEEFSNNKGGTTRMVPLTVTIPGTLNIGDTFNFITRVYDTNGTTLLKSVTAPFTTTVTG